MECPQKKPGFFFSIKRMNLGYLFIGLFAPSREEIEMLQWILSLLCTVLDRHLKLMCLTTTCVQALF